MQLELLVDPGWGSAGQLSRELEREIRRQGEHANVTHGTARVMETAVLLAAISGSVTAFCALVRSLTAIANAKAKQKVIIEGRHGGRIEIPSNASVDDVERLARMAFNFETPKLLLK